MERRDAYVGGWGEMWMCTACGFMPKNFILSSFESGDVCSNCGKRGYMKKVIARPRWINHWLWGTQYLRPEVKGKE